MPKKVAAGSTRRKSIHSIPGMRPTSPAPLLPPTSLSQGNKQLSTSTRLVLQETNQSSSLHTCPGNTQRQWTHLKPRFPTQNPAPAGDDASQALQRAPLQLTQGMTCRAVLDTKPSPTSSTSRAEQVVKPRSGLSGTSQLHEDEMK